MWVLPLIKGLGVPPEFLHIGPVKVGRPRACMLVPMFQYGVCSSRVRLSQRWLQTLPDFRCGLLGLSLGVQQQGLLDGLHEDPCHVAVVARVAVEGCPRINQLDGFGRHPKGARGEIQGGGGWLQVLDGM